MNGYIAGKLFKEGDRKKRIDEHTLLNKQFPEVNWYCPLCNDEINDKTKAVTAEDIFMQDTRKLIQSKYIVAELDDEDPGTVCELGIMMERTFSNPDVYTILVHASDLRMGSTEVYKGIRAPYGYNQYLVGGLLVCKAHIFSNFADLLDGLEGIRESKGGSLS